MSLTQGINQSLNNNNTEVEVGIGGYRLFARVREAIEYKSIIPTDVLEDGGNASDDIINEQLVVTIEGVVSDLFIEDRTFPQLISKDFSAVGEVTALLPGGTQQQIQRISQIDDQLRDAKLQAERIERIAGKAYEFFDNSSIQAKGQQEKFIDYMEAVHFGRQPIELSVNYRTYQNMGLASFTPVRDNQTGDTAFTATFAQLQYTSLIYSTVESPSKAIAGSVADPASKGGQNPETNPEKSLLSSLIGG